MLLLTWLSCSLLLHPSVRRSTRPRMQAEAAAEVVGVTFEEEYSDRLPEWLITRAAELGYTNPTPVQQETLDTVLDGHDAIVQAKTGSGKTLAYLLPILANLKPTSSVQALVLLPTRELATQVARAARQLAAGSPDRLLVMALMDGSGAKRQRKWLVAEPPQVIVANVQQAESVLRAGLLRMGGLRMLVVDEVDECVSTDATRALLHGLLSTQLRVPQSTAAGAPVRQTLFVSATVPRSPSGRLACTRPPDRHTPRRDPPSRTLPLPTCCAGAAAKVLRVAVRVQGLVPHRAQAAARAAWAAAAAAAAARVRRVRRGEADGRTARAPQGTARLCGRDHRLLQGGAADGTHGRGARGAAGVRPAARRAERRAAPRLARRGGARAARRQPHAPALNLRDVSQGAGYPAVLAHHPLRPPEDARGLHARRGPLRPHGTPRQRDDNLHRQGALRAAEDRKLAQPRLRRCAPQHEQRHAPSTKRQSELQRVQRV